MGAAPKKWGLSQPPGAEAAPSPRGLPPAPGGWGAEAAPGGSPRGLGGWGQPPGARGLVAANGGWGLPCSLNATLEDGTCHTSDSVEWKSATGLGIFRE